MTPSLRAALLLIATLAFGLAPLITPPFTGYDPGIFPIRIERPSIQPAGYAFAIWSVIYLWLAVHAVFGLWKRRDVEIWDAARLPLAVSIALGAVWLWIAPDYPRIATAAIWAMLALAMVGFLRAPTAPDRWLLSAPMAIYAGWLSAASSVSLGVVVAGYVLAIAVVVQWRKPAMPVYGLTVIWALVGVIWVNRADNLTVAVVAGLGVAVMAITLLALRKRA
jgi:TspO/MBR family